ncbi:hypothetical protein FA95DRAFT_172046 [Auriscalpium vulgare]|uniref:Uncharacterized protein n=1 Tax=Auriscalpium vulgare TaxID=40419 RepID=A0ACB8RMH4_9AGAM|nr:hypothetical protein FA95DRAFT_172046 [Auriscalpium vulgare]
MPLSDIINKSFYYTYDDGGWRYQFWLKSASRIIYTIHGGPMEGRSNYQQCHILEVRESEIFQISWVEGQLSSFSPPSHTHPHNLKETDTIVSLIVDLPRKRITTFGAFSHGHWSRPEDAHGNKRNPVDLQRWRGLASIEGSEPKNRHIMSKYATIHDIVEGKCEFEDIDEDAETL